MNSICKALCLEPGIHYYNGCYFVFSILMYLKLDCNLYVISSLMFVFLGVEAKFGITVGKLEWLESRSLWLLTGLEGQDLGHFDAVVATDKNIVSPRFTGLTGRSPPLG